MAHIHIHLHSNDQMRRATRDIFSAKYPMLTVIERNNKNVPQAYKTEMENLMNEIFANRNRRDAEREAEMKKAQQIKPQNRPKPLNEMYRDIQVRFNEISTKEEQEYDQKKAALRTRYGMPLDGMRSVTELPRK